MSREERYVPFSIMPSAKPVLATRPPPTEPEPDLPPTTTKVVRDLKWLAPTFRERVEKIVDSLEKQGFEPLVWETLRTRERGRYLEKKGASRNGDRSMHIYGAACDIICKKHKWQCKKHGCKFFQALGKTSKRHRVYWGGDWRTIVDLPHIQGVPVSLQNAVRRAEDPADVVDKHLSKRPI